MKAPVQEQLNKILDEQFQQEAWEDGYLVDIEIKTGNRIQVFIDKDKGLTLKNCQEVSRKLEAYLDEVYGETPYTIEVSSPGLSRPLTMPRQYIKNIGRTLKVVTNDGEKVVGKLTEADEKGITLHYIEKYKEGKKKKKVEVNRPLLYSDIKEAIVKINFKSS